MTTNFKHFLALALVGLGIQGAVQAAPTFEHVKTLDFGTTDSTAVRRIVAVTPDNNGTIYFSDNQTDAIRSINLFKPEYFGRDIKSSDIDSTVIHSGAATDVSFTGNSYAGLALDPISGDLIGSGASNRYGASGGSSVYRFSKAGSAWNITNLSLSTPVSLSGVKYIGTNKYAFTDAKTGNIYFYELNSAGNALNAIGDITGATSGIWAPGLAADVQNNKLYQGLGDNRVGTAISGQVNSFNFNFVSGEFPFASGSYGFTGTSNGSIIAGVPPTSGTDTNGSAPHVYQPIAVSSTGKYLSVAHNPGGRGYDTVKNSFKVYDVSVNPPALVATLNGSETPDKFGMYGEIKGYSTTFLTYNGKEYLLTFFTQANAMSGTKPATLPYTKRVYTGYIYELKDNSDIDTWNMY